MDALKKLLEQAQKLQEAALQAELDKIRIQEQSVAPRRSQGWSNDAPRGGSAGWSSDTPAGSQGWSSDTPVGASQWSGQTSHSNWVDPATQPVRTSTEFSVPSELTVAERLRDPETLRTFFLLAEALGPPPGLKDDEDW